MKKSISKKIMKNYISMYVLTVLLTICAIMGMLIFLGSNFNGYDEGNYANQLMKDDYNGIETEIVKEHNGTAFIVNKDLDIIPLCGDNIPQKSGFTISEWTDFIKKMDEDNRDFECDIAYNDKIQMWLIVEMPVAVQGSFNINTTKEVLPESIFIITILFLMCFLVNLIYIYIYSKFTSKYFLKPLNMFLEMIRNLEKGKYKERLKLHQDDEFGIIAQSFNKLADYLESEKKLRKESENNRKRLILDISHDLKNPLTSTMGSLELCLNQNGLTTKQKHYINMAYENSVRANLLINDLFEYSKMDSPEYKMKLKKTDICEYMRIQIASELDSIEEAGFNSEYDIPERSIYADIDEVNFGRVIHNLISNTIKYNKENTEIKIAVKENENSIEIIIKDNGIGIDTNMKSEVFEVFVRSDGSSEASGTGLGLTIAKKIVTMHKGRICLETDINMGCTFVISIPKSND